MNIPLYRCLDVSLYHFSTPSLSLFISICLSLDMALVHTKYKSDSHSQFDVLFCLSCASFGTSWNFGLPTLHLVCLSELKNEFKRLSFHDTISTHWIWPIWFNAGQPMDGCLIAFYFLLVSLIIFLLICIRRYGKVFIWLHAIDWKV